MYILQAATSKLLNLADLNATSGNFGFRGEALASISEVSLLEILTRTYGRANGYCKVLKVWNVDNFLPFIHNCYFVLQHNIAVIDASFATLTFLYLWQGCKCLYLGIDDDRKEVGTSGNNNLVNPTVAWFIFF